MRALHRLKPLQVKQLKVPGMYSDGGGLWLQVASAAAKSWVFRYAVDGRERYMGLGSAATFTLDEAREAARECRKLRHAGIDPIEHRKAGRQQKRLEAAKAMTFDECAAAYIDSHEAGWRNAKHAAQWRTTLKQYVSPVLGQLPVQAIDTALVMKVIEPIWRDRTETASRVRGRIESVLDWATVREYRSGDNPARWRGHLGKLLPARSRLRKKKHLAALPYTEINALVTLLRAQEGIAARALEFLILTAARTGEVLGTPWSEIDLHEKTWTIPGERMKGGREHRVPLAPRCIAILNEMKMLGGDYVFPGAVDGKPLSHAALSVLLHRMARSDLTVHGFRSTFRDWAAEQTNFPREIAEKALAHRVGDETERSYQRGDLLAKRRKLMEAWARYCDSPAPVGKVVPLRHSGST
jgi:integrase